MSLRRLFPAGILVLAALAGGCSHSDPEQADPMQPETPERYLAYFGTFTRGEHGGKGIYVSRFEVSSGRLSPIRLALEAEDPSYLAVHPNRLYLYSTNEVGGRPGTVSAYAIDPATGGLSLLNRAPAQGRGTCHIGLAGDGSMLAVANYVTGTVASYPVLGDGRLGETVSIMQHRGAEAPHPHSANFAPDDRFLIVPDVGTHKVHLYRVDPSRAVLQPHDPAEFPLWVQSRARLHRRVLHRPGQRPPERRRLHPHPGQLPAKLQPGPHRQVADCAEPGKQHRRHLCRRLPDRQTHAHGTGAGAAQSLLPPLGSAGCRVTAVTWQPSRRGVC